MIQLRHYVLYYVKRLIDIWKVGWLYLFHHCYCGILASVITIPTVIPYCSYSSRRITAEFSPFSYHGTAILLHSPLPCHSPVCMMESFYKSAERFFSRFELWLVSSKFTVKWAWHSLISFINNNMGWQILNELNVAHGMAFLFLVITRIYI